MLAVYKEVLTTTKWVMTAFLGILTLSGLGALWLFQHGLRGIGEVQARANELKSELESAEEQSKRLEEKWKEQSEEARSLRRELEVIKEQARSTKQESRDIEPLISRLKILASVEIYGVRLLSADKRISQVAKRALVELSKDEDPVVRRECARVFGSISDYPECATDTQEPFIISRLREMAVADPERGVQLEARLALKKLGIDLKELDSGQGPD
jgi:cell division protein FtsB